MSIYALHSVRAVPLLRCAARFLAFELSLPPVRDCSGPLPRPLSLCNSFALNRPGPDDVARPTNPGIHTKAVLSLGLFCLVIGSYKTALTLCNSLLVNCYGPVLSALRHFGTGTPACSELLPSCPLVKHVPAEPLWPALNRLGTKTVTCSEFWSRASQMQDRCCLWRRQGQASLCAHP